MRASLRLLTAVWVVWGHKVALSPFWPPTLGKGKGIGVGVKTWPTLVLGRCTITFVARAAPGTFPSPLHPPLPVPRPLPPPCSPCRRAAAARVGIEKSKAVYIDTPWWPALIDIVIYKIHPPQLYNIDINIDWKKYSINTSWLKLKLNLMHFFLKPVLTSLVYCMALDGDSLLQPQAELSLSLS